MKTVDVSTKIETLRSAKAYGRIRLKPETVSLIKEKKLPKGDLVEATKLTGIMGAKKTGELLPFCHPIALDYVGVEVKVGENSVEVFSEVRGIARTGYEMEALTAVSCALLNVYDMCKAFDETMVIEEIRLLSKSGGKSDWQGNLEGMRVEVVAEDKRVLDLIKEEVEKLGGKVSEGGRLKIYVGREQKEGRNISSFEAVVALYDFSLDPKGVAKEIKLIRDSEGRVHLLLPEDEGKIRRFFGIFGGLLRSLLE